jgi:hypothetical protein
MCIAALHVAIGLLTGTRLVQDPKLQELVGDRAPVLELTPFMGLQAAPDLAVMMTFWYLFFGLLLFLYGSLIRHSESITPKLPTFVAVHLAGLALLGGFFLPASGFWLALVPAYLVLRQQRAVSAR